MYCRDSNPQKSVLSGWQAGVLTVIPTGCWQVVSIFGRDLRTTLSRLPKRPGVSPDDTPSRKNKNGKSVEPRCARMRRFAAFV
jgi:hypothetical protein